MWVARDGKGLPLPALGVVLVQNACLAVVAQQDFQGFGRLQAADDADQWGKHAKQGAGTVVGGFAVKQAGVAGAVVEVGAVHGDLAFKTHGGPRYQRFAGGNGGGVEGLAGGEVVAAVENEVVLGDELGKGGGIELLVDGMDLAVAVDGVQSLTHGVDFGLADVVFAVGGLALQVAGVDGVVVGDGELADACGGQVGQGGRTESAASDYHDVGG